MYTPPQWRIAFPIVGVCIAALATGLVRAWHPDHPWAAALYAGLIVGLLVSIAWALRHFRATLALAIASVALLLAGALAFLSALATLLALGVAAAVLFLWMLLYDRGVTGRANTERPTPLQTLGEDRDVRALIIYHSTQGRFQPAALRAYGEGLLSQGWGIDMTTASPKTPTNLAPYRLLVLGCPSYNWRPAAPILAYLDRLGDLHGMSVVLVVSGGGLTADAMRVLRARIDAMNGHVIEAIELWTHRPNAKRYGTTQPTAIMRAAGARRKAV